MWGGGVGSQKVKIEVEGSKNTEVQHPDKYRELRYEEKFLISMSHCCKFIDLNMPISIWQK